jgi:hypothetical protein
MKSRINQSKAASAALPKSSNWAWLLATGSFFCAEPKTRFVFS